MTQYMQRDVPGSFSHPPVPPTLFERATGPVACAALLAAIIAAGVLVFAAIIYGPWR